MHSTYRASVVGLACALAACDVEISAPATGQLTQSVTTATYDPALKAPACRGFSSVCTSGSSVLGNGSAGPEFNAPNTINASCQDGGGGTYHVDESLDILTVSSVNGDTMAPGTTVRIDASVWTFSTAADRLDLYYASSATNPTWVFLTTLTPFTTGFPTLSATYVLPAGALQAVRGQFRYLGSASPCTAGAFNDRDDLVFAVADDHPPSTAITDPAPGTTVSIPIAITATASDDFGVTKVELYRDGTVLIGTATAAPYTVTWNPYGTPDGAHALTSKAYDSSGHTAVSAAVSVNVLDPDAAPPQVAVTYPAGAGLTGVVTLAATASDGDDAIVELDYYVDGALVGSATGGSFSQTWDSQSVATGPHAFSARACDAAGHCTPSNPVVATVVIDTAPPVTAVTFPTEGAIVSGTISVTASASDDVAVDHVELYADGARIGTAAAAPYTVTWSSGSVPDGAHTLTSVAYDLVGNSTTSAPVHITSDSRPPPALTSRFDFAVSTQRCVDVGWSCDTGTAIDGRGNESNMPNTIDHACADGTSGTYHSDESLDRLKLSTVDGWSFAPGKTVRIDATVWAYAAFSTDTLDLYYAANAASPSWVLIGSLSPTRAGAQTLSTTYVLPSGTLQAIRGQFRYGGSAGPCTSGSFNDRDDLVFAVRP